MSFKCFLSEDEISSKSYIIVLQPERNKYLKWELPSPQATVDLIKSENIKLPVKSYTIFKLNCASAIRESHNFITDTSEVEIIKTTIAIWNCAEESIKEKYNQLNMDLRDLESPAPSGLPEETSEVVVSDLPLSYREAPFYNSRYSEDPSPIGLINLPFPPTINIDNLVPVPRRFDGDKPPRSPNAFLIYRKAYVKELHSRRINLRMTQISSMASESWKQEPDSVKAEYKRLEEEAKKRYNEIWTSEQRRRQHRKHQQQSLFIDSKPTNELGLSNLTQTPPQTAIDINQLDFSQSSLWPHQAISPLQNLTPLYNSNYYSEARSFFYRPLENVSLYRVEEGSPGAYSWNLSQQLDKDVFGAIKRRIEELEKTKVAKSNQGDKMFF
ncbi:hypothetical protein RhiirA4_438698 [Rhizophagus irregularis]|uniref:HMG box domain-containing protein n=1 Tax=Rhizophagus irregularis TaxID=588596 RepID=A0A2I1FSW3_9GLOM|nr:hypothetical protein RhiirA4_438698 [Rhizophagus irregularis]